MRYQLRSRLEGLKQTSSCFVLPNPRWGSGRTSTIRSLPDRGELTLLRIGRPDPIKWSNFELEYAVALHRKTRRPVRLVRVGYPGPHAVTSVAGVRVEDLPYQDDLSEIYRGADLYVHYSRIGETFGNTVFEAQETGLPVIFAASLGWDCAPVEYLPQSSFLFASRGWLLKNADTSLSRFEFSSKSVGSSRRPVREYGEAIMQIANTAPEEMTELRSISSGVGYVWMLGTRGHGFSAAARVGAVLRMVLRSLRNRVIRS
ncbi:glycosyltransferase family 4 protein [Nocardioides sp. REDSEA-S30_B4]|uniref:glycosyltransferase family 4 protein n=1 Tax=Nocardioides sp. REDSEA-S30_B4 TaxID=1811552 RepID=UPI0025EBAD0D|nr:glycosyltransferase family 4 protein [Nocardioides sp. REDSEA-S30_B4]